jgi:hypothetical protein
MKHGPCSVERMDAATILSGNVGGRFRECWHERFNYILLIFYRYTNHDYDKLRTVRIRLANIGRAVNCAMPPVLTP